MKILVTGSTGQLGKCFNEIKSNYQNYEFILKSKVDLDIANEKDIEAFLSTKKIDFIINCAAYTKVDAAEHNPAEAERVNVLGVKNLASLSTKYECKLIHISTEFIFDGLKTSPYKEADQPNPINVYGQTKFLGEELIKKYASQYIIIRTAWLYSWYGHNFLKTIIRLAENNKEIPVVTDRQGTPTNALDLAHAILNLVLAFEKGKNQVYHYANEGVASYYDFASEIVRLLNLKTKILPITNDQYIAQAKRPYYSVLDKSKIKNDFQITILHWEKSLKNLLDQQPC
jgi:dTDP-4-dehydrorhamnose reductase